MTFAPRAFRHILTTEQDNHGVNKYEMDDETVDGFWQQVDDDLIDTIIVGAVTTA